MNVEPGRSVGGELITVSAWLTTEGLSELLGGIPIATIRGWRHAGTGPPYVKFGGAVRYARAVVERWIAEGGDRTDIATGQASGRALSR